MATIEYILKDAEVARRLSAANEAKYIFIAACMPASCVERHLTVLLYQAESEVSGSPDLEELFDHCTHCDVAVPSECESSIRGMQDWNTSIQNRKHVPRSQTIRGIIDAASEKLMPIYEELQARE